MAPWNLVCLICVIMITIHYSLLTHFGFVVSWSRASLTILLQTIILCVLSIVLCVIFIFSHMFYVQLSVGAVLVVVSL